MFNTLRARVYGRIMRGVTCAHMYKFVISTQATPHSRGINRRRDCRHCRVFFLFHTCTQAFNKGLFFIKSMQICGTTTVQLGGVGCEEENKNFSIVGRALLPHPGPQVRQLHLASRAAPPAPTLSPIAFKTLSKCNCFSSLLRLPLHHTAVPSLSPCPRRNRTETTPKNARHVLHLRPPWRRGALLRRKRASREQPKSSFR